MHGFSSHSGSGGGGAAPGVNYMTDDRYYNKEEGIWQPRDPLPEVLEGDPELMIQMIDALDHKHTYTSGVLSFTHSDTEKLKQHGLSEAIADITGRLKEMLFAGISPEHQHILIVRHCHLDRLELHYMLPRHNYEVDRAWNPAPPGKGKFRQMDALVDLINVKYGLDDPRDPLRARITQEIRWEPDYKKATREMLNNFFKQAVIDGAIDSRKELIDLAKKAGFEITRVSKDYISMREPGAEKAIRLKGEIYHEKFTSRVELTDTKTKSAERAAYLAKPAVAQRYKQALRERQDFIEKRFEKALGVVRDGEKYKEVQHVSSAKRGKITEVSKIFPGDINNNSGTSHSANNCKVDRNDGSGAEINYLIGKAERIIIDTECSTNRACRLLEAGTAVVKSAIGRIRETIETPPYSLIPTAPLSMATAGPSEVSGGFSPSDTGDPESDRIINSKRAESIAAAQQESVRNKQAALRNQESLNIITSLIPAP
ncbi:TPA: relaxase/mobilization nuclease domain-containing protein [Pseudomonas aeruginosa]|uniref:relaxase/mobilization nuclease domain-containing protein n=1 Tax=Pseudomonas sp. NBRC 111135 TaxID=1661050 RepID=UPI0015A750D6|nr:relaxase/mobilization nuclease domain-containing protein [Pseudomonas sp. NBRC 111135]